MIVLWINREEQISAITINIQRPRIIKGADKYANTTSLLIYWINVLCNWQFRRYVATVKPTSKNYPLQWATVLFWSCHNSHPRWRNWWWFVYVLRFIANIDFLVHIRFSSQYIPDIHTRVHRIAIVPVRWSDAPYTPPFFYRAHVLHVLPTSSPFYSSSTCAEIHVFRSFDKSSWMVSPEYMSHIHLSIYPLIIRLSVRRRPRKIKSGHMNS